MHVFSQKKKGYGICSVFINIVFTSIKIPNIKIKESWKNIGVLTAGLSSYWELFPYRERRSLYWNGPSLVSGYFFQALRYLVTAWRAILWELSCWIPASLCISSGCSCSHWRLTWRNNRRMLITIMNIALVSILVTCLSTSLFNAMIYVSFVVCNAKFQQMVGSHWLDISHGLVIST